MKRIVSFIIQVVLLVAMIPVYFIRFFHEVGNLPGYDNNGEFFIIRRDYYYSPYVNLSSLDLTWLMYLNFALIGMSLIVGIFSLVEKENKTYKKMNYIIFGITVLCFVIAIFAASLCHRNY